MILIADKLNEAEFNEPEIFTYIMPIFLEIARSEIQYLKIDYDDLNDLVREPFAELYDFYTVESIVDALNNAYGTILEHYREESEIIRPLLQFFLSTEIQMSEEYGEEE